MMNLHLVDNANGTYNVENWKDENGYDYEKLGVFAFDDDYKDWFLWDDCQEDNKGSLHFWGDSVEYFDDLQDSFEQYKEDYSNWLRENENC